MIRIIEEGKKEFVGACVRCSCKFSYELQDLILGLIGYVILCPSCGETCYHLSQSDQKEQLNIKY